MNYVIIGYQPTVPVCLPMECSLYFSCLFSVLFIAMSHPTYRLAVVRSQGYYQAGGHWFVPNYLGYLNK